MCLDCGCHDWPNCHGDIRHVTSLNIFGAVDANGGALSYDDVTSNIREGMAALHDHHAEKDAPEFAEFLSSLRDPGALGCEVVKSSEERRYTLGVAYAANRADPYRGADGFRDFTGADVLEKAAWSFMKNGAAIGLDHKHGTDGAGRVVESYVYRGPDWPQDNGYVVKAGDWLLGVVWTPEAWQTIKSGKRRGFSMQGDAHRREPAAEALAALR